MQNAFLWISENELLAGLILFLSWCLIFLCGMKAAYAVTPKVSRKRFYPLVFEGDYFIEEQDGFWTLHSRNYRKPEAMEMEKVFSCLSRKNAVALAKWLNK